MTLHPKKKFYPNPNKIKILNKINNQLKKLLPPKKFKKISTRPSQIINLHFIQNNILYTQKNINKIKNKIIITLLHIIFNIYFILPLYTINIYIKFTFTSI